MQTSASPKSSRNLGPTRRGAGSWGKASLQQPGHNEPSVERGDPVSCPAVPWRSSPKGAGRDLGQEEPSLLLSPSWAKARVLSSPPAHGLSVPRNLGLGDGRERGRPDSDPGPVPRPSLDPAAPAPPATPVGPVPPALLRAAAPRPPGKNVDRSRGCLCLLGTDGSRQPTLRPPPPPARGSAGRAEAAASPLGCCRGLLGLRRPSPTKRTA